MRLEIQDKARMYAEIYDYIYNYNKRYDHIRYKEILESFLGIYPAVMIIECLDNFRQAGILVNYHQYNPQTNQGEMKYSIAKDLYVTS